MKLLDLQNYFSMKKITKTLVNFFQHTGKPLLKKKKKDNYIIVFIVILIQTRYINKTMMWKFKSPFNRSVWQLCHLGITLHVTEWHSSVAESDGIFLRVLGQFEKNSIFSTRIRIARFRTWKNVLLLFNKTQFWV